MNKVYKKKWLDFWIFTIYLVLFSFLIVTIPFTIVILILLFLTWKKSYLEITEKNVIINGLFSQQLIPIKKINNLSMQLGHCLVIDTGNNKMARYMNLQKLDLIEAYTLLTDKMV